MDHPIHLPDHYVHTRRRLCQKGGSPALTVSLQRHPEKTKLRCVSLAILRQLTTMLLIVILAPQTALVFVHRLHRLATEHGFDPHSLDGEWAVYPGERASLVYGVRYNTNLLCTVCQQQRLQCNSYDCGVWTPACITPVLHGFILSSCPRRSLQSFAYDFSV